MPPDTTDEAPRPLNDIMIYEAYYALTGDFFLALVLGQFSWYQLAAARFDEFIEQKNARSRQRGIEDGYIDPTGGWFWKSAAELCEELMYPFKRSKAQALVRP